MKDLNDEILLHQDIGFGPKYINYERKIEYNTLAKEAIRIKLKNEILSEEMRLLYVALTRSKEKIIITGVEPKNKKSAILPNTIRKIPASLLKSTKSYLEWLELICLYNEVADILEVKYHKKSEIIKGEIIEQENNQSFIKILEQQTKNNKHDNNIDEILNWEYPNITLTKIEGSSSVTKMTKKTEDIDITKKPKFLSNTIELTKAQIGTTMHLVLQKLEFKTYYTEDKIIELVEDLVKKEIITRKEAESVDILKILKFTKSDIFEATQKAKKLFKEKPFYINIPIKNSAESILVQGVIDLYFFNEDGEIILVDYKTDYVKENLEEDLINKYKEQLKIYEMAISNWTQKKVKEKYIYSTYLDKKIKL